MEHSAVPAEHLKKHFNLFLLAVFIVAGSCLGLLVAVEIALFGVGVLATQPIQNHLSVVVSFYHQFEFEYYN